MKEHSTIRIMIADDHYVVRMGLIALISTESDMKVVSEVGDGAQAVESFSRLMPDLALLDLRMPVKDGTEATAEIRSRFPTARILVLTAFDGDEDIHRALIAGAQGYVLKGSTGDVLIPAIRAVAAGQKWIPKEVSARLAARHSFQELTPRELEVLRQVAKGLANKEIADALGITEHTTKDHIKSILGKLLVPDRTAAVTAALQRGLVHL